MLSLPKILIAGGNSQVAQALLAHSQRENFNISAFPYHQLDITDADSIKTVFANYKPDIVINTAAYTLVDEAETERRVASAVNFEGAKNIARAATSIKSHLIHLSTDYVFNGESNQPYVETDPIDPINYYGFTKYLGEQAVRHDCLNSVILRTSSIFSPYRDNFVKTILRLSREKESISIIADQYMCPTAATDIAGIIYLLASHPITQSTYHYASKPIVSWYSFATRIVAIAREFISLKVKTLQAISSADYPTPAKRPRYSCLSSQKILSEYALPNTDWEPALKQTIASLVRNLS